MGNPPQEKGLLTSKGRGEWEGAELGGSRGMAMLGALYGDGPPDGTARGEQGRKGTFKVDVYLV